MINMIRGHKGLTFIAHSILVLIGNAFVAFGVASFAIPANIIVGGAPGLGLVVKQFLPISVSLSVLIINIIALVLGMFFLGKKFIIGTIASTFAYPFFLRIFENISFLQHLTNDVLLATIYSALLSGVGLGIIFRIGYSTGGLDIPPVIVNKYTHIPIGTLVYIFDVLVLIMQFPFFSPEGILYGIIQTIICGMVINRLEVIGENNIQVIIISEKYETLREEIYQTIDRGVTYLNITTGYMSKTSRALMVVMSRREFAQINDVILNIDPTAFIIASEVHSVKGRGFTLPNVNL